MVDYAVLSSISNSGEDLKWKVPIAVVLYPKVAVSGDLDLRESYFILRSYLNYVAQRERVMSENEHPGDCPADQISFHQKQSASYFGVLCGSVYGYKFVITERGYVGVVPKITRVGDTIAIAQGGQVPFVFS